MFSLMGYKALITGASGAIGKAISISLAEQGADVSISGTKIDALKAVADEIKMKTGKVAAIFQCDLFNSDEISRISTELNQIDILVNNAGINKDMLFSKMTEKDFDDVLYINLKVIFTLTQIAVTSMASRRFGRIINISSVVGKTGNIGQANYCASKAGIIGMTKAIALEYAKRGITINCIAPGAIL
ncbi:MAG: SDR family NAD(P)-dependent oxidoreductase, partial [Holosporales bacterium]|nr:SDR family NAD(P)-dependent oxidoreductase [Holosporales bacterium]